MNGIPIVTLLQATWILPKSNWKRSSMDWNANLNLIFRYKLDDPLDAVAVHGGGGNNYLQPMQQTLLADYKLTIIVWHLNEYPQVSGVWSWCPSLCRPTERLVNEEFSLTVKICETNSKFYFPTYSRSHILPMDCAWSSYCCGYCNSGLVYFLVYPSFRGS